MDGWFLALLQDHLTRPKCESEDWEENWSHTINHCIWWHLIHSTTIHLIPQASCLHQWWALKNRVVMFQLWNSSHKITAIKTVSYLDSATYCIGANSLILHSALIHLPSLHAALTINRGNSLITESNVWREEGGRECERQCGKPEASAH